MQDNIAKADIHQYISMYITRYFIDQSKLDVIDPLKSNELWRIGSVNLLYLVYDIENTYKIKFSKEDYDSMEFYTIDGLAQLTANKLLHDTEIRL